MNDDWSKVVDLSNERFVPPLDKVKDQKSVETTFTVESPKRSLSKLVVPEKTQKQIRLPAQLEVEFKIKNRSNQIKT